MNGSEFCKNLFYYHKPPIETVLHIIGLFLSTINIAVYLKLIKGQISDMYKYLLFKSIVDIFYIFTILFSISSFVKDKSRTVLFMIYIQWIINDYVSRILWSMSTLCELGACFSRLKQVYL